MGQKNLLFMVVLFITVFGTIYGQERAKKADNPLPDAKDIKSIVIKFDHPKHDDVEFVATTRDWEIIKAKLSPAKKDPKPSLWEWLGSIKIIKKDGQSAHVELYTTSSDPGAFSAGKTFKDRTYFRGGKSSGLVKAVSDAYERSKKRK